MAQTRTCMCSDSLVLLLVPSASILSRPCASVPRFCRSTSVRSSQTSHDPLSTLHPRAGHPLVCRLDLRFHVSRASRRRILLLLHSSPLLVLTTHTHSRLQRLLAASAPSPSAIRDRRSSASLAQCLPFVVPRPAPRPRRPTPLASSCRRPSAYRARRSVRRTLSSLAPLPPPSSATPQSSSQRSSAACRPLPRLPLHSFHFRAPTARAPRSRATSEDSPRSTRRPTTVSRAPSTRCTSFRTTRRTSSVPSTAGRPSACSTSSSTSCTTPPRLTTASSTSPSSTSSVASPGTTRRRRRRRRCSPLGL
ncbi:hypothetical protein DMC30DRAFT_392163 [Rhodotorula diobovata]|uniref:Proteophosphoglycan ppg4 n=1 Tax=Rhodotorula diobovata TaxID=5288 RepID=A0A5C5G1G8_9BASI|nr:hypothetical protein DMC30DRAFT_392163 [Rhodotorula diobovata]